MMDYFYTAPFIWEPEAVLVWRRRPRGSSHTNHALTALNHLNHRPDSPKNHTALSPEDHHTQQVEHHRHSNKSFSEGTAQSFVFSLNSSLQKSGSRIWYLAKWTVHMHGENQLALHNWTNVRSSISKCPT